MFTGNRVGIDVTQSTSSALISDFTLVKESNKLRPQGSETLWLGYTKIHGCGLIEKSMNYCSNTNRANHFQYRDETASHSFNARGSLAPV